MSNVLFPVVSDNPQAASGPQTVYLDRLDVPDVFRRAFPGYRGRQFCVKSAESVTLDANYWSGGTKYTYRGVDLVTGAVLPPDCRPHSLLPLADSMAASFFLSSGERLLIASASCSSGLS